MATKENLAIEGQAVAETHGDQRLPGEIRLGLQCPMCARTYEVYLNPSEPIINSKDFYVPCCQLCKTHPALNVIMIYPIRWMRVVKELLAGGIIKP